MQTILIVVHILLAVGLVSLVLIQHGKGADMGAAFGSGASATVFGARGAASFLSRATALLATLFFVTSMALAYFASQSGKPKGLMEEAVEGTPAAIEQLTPETKPPAEPVSEIPVTPSLGVVQSESADESSVPEVPQPAAPPPETKE